MRLSHKLFKLITHTITTVTAMATTYNMRTIAVRNSKITYPTGNKNFAVKQSFPSAFPPEESDPFLMCDYFGPALSTGKETDPDSFPVAWHPHRGMDIVTYLTQGTGRHADSLGNRGEFASPGMQWISVGSGIEHAEGGGTPAGEYMAGFQIWINVPSALKMEDPRYGTEGPDKLPVLDNGVGVRGRLIAGEVGSALGPFRTTQPVEIVDFVADAGASHVHTLSSVYDNCLGYVYEGSGRIAGSAVNTHQMIRLDASEASGPRDIEIVGGSSGLKIILFSGKRLNQPVAWHGPFVMTTDEEIERTILEYRTGRFLRVRSKWDYKRLSTAPREVQAAILGLDGTGTGH